METEKLVNIFLKDAQTFINVQTNKIDSLLDGEHKKLAALVRSNDLANNRLNKNKFVVIRLHLSGKVVRLSTSDDFLDNDAKQNHLLLQAPFKLKGFAITGLNKTDFDFDIGKEQNKTREKIIQFDLKSTFGKPFNGKSDIATMWKTILQRLHIARIDIDLQYLEFLFQSSGVIIDQSTGKFIEWDQSDSSKELQLYLSALEKTFPKNEIDDHPKWDFALFVMIAMTDMNGLNDSDPFSEITKCKSLKPNVILPPYGPHGSLWREANRSRLSGSFNAECFDLHAPVINALMIGQHAKSINFDWNVFKKADSFLDELDDGTLVEVFEEILIDFVSEAHPTDFQNNWTIEFNGTLGKACQVCIVAYNIYGNDFSDSQLLDCMGVDFIKLEK